VKRLPVKSLLFSMLVVALVLALAGPALADPGGGHTWEFSRSCKAGTVQALAHYNKAEDGSATLVAYGQASSGLGYCTKNLVYVNDSDVRLLNCNSSAGSPLGISFHKDLISIRTDDVRHLAFNGRASSPLGSCWVDASYTQEGGRPRLSLQIHCGCDKN